MSPPFGSDSLAKGPISRVRLAVAHPECGPLSHGCRRLPPCYSRTCRLPLRCGSSCASPSPVATRAVTGLSQPGELLVIRRVSEPASARTTARKASPPLVCSSSVVRGQARICSFFSDNEIRLAIRAPVRAFEDFKAQKSEKLAGAELPLITVRASAGGRDFLEVQCAHDSPSVLPSHSHEQGRAGARLVARARRNSRFGRACCSSTDPTAGESGSYEERLKRALSLWIR